MQNTSALLPRWAAGELAALSRDYRKSVKPVFSETIPDNVQLLAHMQDTHHQMNELATIYKKYDRNYRSQSLSKIWEDIATNPLLDTGPINKYLAVEVYRRPPTAQESNDFMRMLYPEGVSRVYGENWRLANVDGDRNFAVYTNESAKKTYISFDHYSPIDLSAKNVLFKPNTDDNVVFNQIPLNRTIDTSNARFSEETGNLLRDEVQRYREMGHEVRFTGYSLGGYVAKYWGSKLNIDQDVINAHIFPHNDFAKTSASTNFHTTATDETSFKYGLLSLKGAAAFGPRDTHTVYPPSNEISNMDILQGNFWGNHLKESFTAPQESLNIAEGEYAMAASERYANYTGAAAVGLNAADIAMDIADKDYKVAALKGTTAALGLAAPTALNGGVAAYMAYEGTKELKQGIETRQWGTVGRGTRHIAEGAAQGLSILSKTEGAMPAAAAAVGGIELAFQASSEAKAGDRHDAAVHGVESALLDASSGLFVAPIPGARLAAVGALAAAGTVSLGDRIGRKVWHARHDMKLIPMTHSRDLHGVKESANSAPVPAAHITGPLTFSEHTTTRQAPVWHVTSKQHSVPMY